MYYLLEMNSDVTNNPELQAYIDLIYNKNKKYLYASSDLLMNKYMFIFKAESKSDFIKFNLNHKNSNDKFYYKVIGTFTDNDLFFLFRTFPRINFGNNSIEKNRCSNLSLYEDYQKYKENKITEKEFYFLSNQYHNFHIIFNDSLDLTMNFCIEYKLYHKQEKTRFAFEDLIEINGENNLFLIENKLNTFNVFYDKNINNNYYFNITNGSAYNLTKKYFSLDDDKIEIENTLNQILSKNSNIDITHFYYEKVNQYNIDIFKYKSTHKFILNRPKLLDQSIQKILNKFYMNTKMIMNKAIEYKINELKLMYDNSQKFFNIG